MKEFGINFKVILLLISFPFVVSQKGSAISDNEASQDSSIIVSYIGCAGFLFETETQKVMIDAVFTRSGASGFILPSVETINDINENNEPFNNIDLYLIGHDHEDHFNPGMMDKCMQKNTNARLVCPQEAVDKLKTLPGNKHDTYKDRIFVPVISNFQSLDTTIGNIGIKVTKFPAFSYHPTGVLVFNIKMNNIKIFHLMGTLLNESAYSTYEFNEPDNDILLVTSNYLAGSTSILENKLNFKVAYVHHIYQYSSKSSSYISTCNNLRSKGIQAYVLSSSLEKYKFTKTNNNITIDTVDDELVPTAIHNSLTCDDELKIYPNPFKNSATITCTFNDAIDNKINIYDISGKNVKSKARIDLSLNSGTITIFNNQLESGIYILKIENRIGFSIKKLIIE